MTISKTTSTRSGLTRRFAVLAALALFAAPLAFSAQPAFAQAGLSSGIYQGLWHDGRNLVNQIVIYADHLTTTQVAGGCCQGSTTRYDSAGPSLYRSDRGHQIIVTGPTSYTWINSSGGNRTNFTFLQ